MFCVAGRMAGAGELQQQQRCWDGCCREPASVGDMTRDLINLLCSGGAEIPQELCQGLEACWTWRRRFLIWIFLGWLVGLGIEVSELGQECACNSGISFKNKEERTVRIHGALCVYWASYLFVNITDLGKLCHWLKNGIKEFQKRKNN